MKFEYVLVADEAQIIDIFVEPEQRRQGLAEKKLRAWISELPAKTKIILEVRVSNTPARKLYEKLGFTESYQRKNYYQNPKEDALVLQLSL
jgi:[ribosomal protein S18]-alanine N-acetyltransferase